MTEISNVQNVPQTQYNQTKKVEDKKTEQEPKKMSTATKAFIGASAVAAVVVAGICINKKVSGNKILKEIKGIQTELTRIMKNNESGEIWDNAVLQGHIDAAAKLSPKEKLARLTEIHSTIKSDRGLSVDLKRRALFDVTKLPQNIQDAIANKDQYTATKAYVEYCDNLFHNSKTAGKTIAESVENVFGKGTSSTIKPHTYDLSKEAESIATSTYSGGFANITVTNKNQIADKNNLKNLIHLYSNSGITQVESFKKGDLTIINGIKDGKPVVCLNYTGNNAYNARNSIALFSPTTKMTPAQKDMLMFKDVPEEIFDITPLQDLTRTKDGTNFDAILSFIQTTADRVKSTF